MEETVLIYLEKDNKYLMLYRNKKNNDLNQGKYIGIGGHIEKGESKEDAVVREVKEETNLDIKGFEYRAKIYFSDDNYSEVMHLFHSSNFSGELKECDEGTLFWKDKNELETLPMWEGDKAFLDLLKNSNEYFEMELIYSKGKLISIKRIK